MALGVTMQLPVDDRHNYTREYLKTDLAILMGGRLAEELFLNQMSTGAGNDIERATVGVVLLASGLFVLFESLRGWCALRACGIKTKL